MTKKLLKFIRWVTRRPNKNDLVFAGLREGQTAWVFTGRNLKEGKIEAIANIYALGEDRTLQEYMRRNLILIRFPGNSVIRSSAIEVGAMRALIRGMWITPTDIERGMVMWSKGSKTFVSIDSIDYKELYQRLLERGPMLIARAPVVTVTDHQSGMKFETTLENLEFR